MMRVWVQVVEVFVLAEHWIARRCQTHDTPYFRILCQAGQLPGTEPFVMTWQPSLRQCAA